MQAKLDLKEGRSTKPPKPDPVTSTPVRSRAGSEFIDVRRVQAQAGELKLSDEIYDLPDEILIEWGHDIHSPGADGYRIIPGPAK